VDALTIREIGLCVVAYAEWHMNNHAIGDPMIDLLAEIFDQFPEYEYNVVSAAFEMLYIYFAAVEKKLIDIEK
jgi:hypothetical protein